jgi:tetratricopeptide (TPR) repeat protein
MADRPSAMPGAPTRSSLATNALLVAVSAAVSLCLLGAVEGGLRLAGIGGPDATRTSRLRYQQIWFPTLEPARRADGTPVLRTVDPRLGYQSILREKPPGALRVVSFGGSATAGLGFSPNGTFSRELERILRAAQPGRPVEVLNLGIVAIASQQVKLLVAEAVRELAPDLLLVYCGNNEFLEVHAEKYAEATATPLSRAVARVTDLHLYRTLHRLVRPAGRRDTSMPERGLASEDLRVSQDEIIRHVSMTDAEIGQVVDRYEQNLEAMVDAAEAARVPILLATVASNWEWRGRSDLPPDWLDARLAEPGPATPERLRRAKARLTELLGESPRDERHALLYERATAEAALGELDAARADYRAAMNADPHLRRALDAGNERVRRVAERRGTGFFDAVEWLARRAPDGIVGFDEFYDYVHFTPRGNVLAAAGFFAEMRRMEVVSPAPGFDAEAFAAARLAEVGSLRSDAFAVEEWLGFGFDPAGIHDRDLWKYDRLLEALDRRLAEDPRDLAALVYRGNAHYFRRDGGPEAARDWRAALALAPDDPAIRANLARLVAESRAD